MRLIAPLSLAAAVVMLAACETTPPAAASNAQAQPAQNTAADSKRCERREVTGSRLARCDDGGVRTISGEEVRTTGMPSGGAPVRGSQP